MKVHPNSTPWYPPHHQVLKLTITHWSTPPERKIPPNSVDCRCSIHRIYQSEFCAFGETNRFYFSVQKEKRNTHIIHALLWKMSSSRDFSESCCASAYINFIFTCTLSWSPTGSSHERIHPISANHVKGSFWTRILHCFFARIFFVSINLALFRKVWTNSTCRRFVNHGKPSQARTVLCGPGDGRC